MYFNTDPLVYFLLLQKYRFYGAKVRYVRHVARVSTSIALLFILAFSLPFAVYPTRTVSYANEPTPTVAPEPKIQAPQPDPQPQPQPAPAPAPTPTPVAAPVPKPKPVPVAQTKNERLQAAINTWIATHGGTVTVAVRGITDTSINAQSKGTAKMYTASIYKMFVIERTYNRINNGTWTSSQGGLNVDACVERMIVVSDNNCAVAFGDMLGWSAVDGELNALGFGCSSLNGEHPWSCASDVAELMVRLENGTLVNAAQRESLLGQMKRQVYRNGIPAANPGLAVANKVGFFGGVNTDAGIVYTPNGSYAVAILTSGSSFAAIKDLSATIAAVMN